MGGLGWGDSLMVRQLVPNGWRQNPPGLVRLRPGNPQGLASATSYWSKSGPRLKVLGSRLHPGVGRQRFKGVYLPAWEGSVAANVPQVHRGTDHFNMTFP